VPVGLGALGSTFDVVALLEVLVHDLALARAIASSAVGRPLRSASVTAWSA
jgi:hypothetical protein